MSRSQEVREAADLLEAGQPKSAPGGILDMPTDPATKGGCPVATEVARLVAVAEATDD